LVKYKKCWLFKIVRMSYNLERREYLRKHFWHPQIQDSLSWTGLSCKYFYIDRISIRQYIILRSRKSYIETTSNIRLRKRHFSNFNNEGNQAPDISVKLYIYTPLLPSRHAKRTSEIQSTNMHLCTRYTDMQWNFRWKLSGSALDCSHDKWILGGSGANNLQLQRPLPQPATPG